MYGEGEDVFYYLTLYNENYEMPAMPSPPPGGDGAVSTEDGIVHGLYRFAPGPDGPRRRATILFSGSLATVAGTLVFGDAYQFSLTDPVLARTLKHSYRVLPLTVS